MANRTSASDVLDIMDTDLTESDITPYITYANTLVTEYLDVAEHDLSDAILQEIERYLTAHVVTASRERQAIEQEAGPAREKFSDIFGMGLAATTFGQMALNLDDTGTLADLNESKKKVRLKSIEEDHDFRYGFTQDTEARS